MGEIFRSAAFRKSCADFEAQMEKDLGVRSHSCLCTTPFLTIFLKSLYWYEAILKQTVFQVMSCLCHRCLTQDQDAALPKIWSWRYMSTFGYSICNVHRVPWKTCGSHIRQIRRTLPIISKVRQRVFRPPDRLQKGPWSTPGLGCWKLGRYDQKMSSF